VALRGLLHRRRLLRTRRQQPSYICLDPVLVTNRLRINTFALAARLPTPIWLASASNFARGCRWLRDDAQEVGGGHDRRA